MRHHLAGLLGRTLAELGETMDSREWARWKALDRISPLDHARRAELSAAIIAMNIAAPHCRFAPKASDYMRDYIGDWTAEKTPIGEPVANLADKIDAFFGAM